MSNCQYNIEALSAAYSSRAPMNLLHDEAFGPADVRNMPQRIQKESTKLAIDFLLNNDILNKSITLLMI